MTTFGKKIRQGTPGKFNRKLYRIGLKKSQLFTEESVEGRKRGRQRRGSSQK